MTYNSFDNAAPKSFDSFIRDFGIITAIRDAVQPVDPCATFDQWVIDDSVAHEYEHARDQYSINKVTLATIAKCKTALAVIEHNINSAKSRGDEQSHKVLELELKRNNLLGHQQLIESEIASDNNLTDLAVSQKYQAVIDYNERALKFLTKYKFFKTSMTDALTVDDILTGEKYHAYIGSLFTQITQLASQMVKRQTSIKSANYYGKYLTTTQNTTINQNTKNTNFESLQVSSLRNQYLNLINSTNNTTPYVPGNLITAPGFDYRVFMFTNDTDMRRDIVKLSDLVNVVNLLLRCIPDTYYFLETKVDFMSKQAFSEHFLKLSKEILKTVADNKTRRHWEPYKARPTSWFELFFGTKKSVNRKNESMGYFAFWFEQNKLLNTLGERFQENETGDLFDSDLDVVKFIFDYERPTDEQPC